MRRLLNVAAQFDARATTVVLSDANGRGGGIESMRPAQRSERPSHRGLQASIGISGDPKRALLNCGCGPHRVGAVNIRCGALARNSQMTRA
jgi:hypothetical protein